MAGLRAHLAIHRGQIQPADAVADATGGFAFPDAQDTTYRLELSHPDSAWSGPIAVVGGVRQAATVLVGYGSFDGSGDCLGV